MKQINLEPKEYRAQPIKGEPVLAPGALRRVAFNVALIVVMCAVCLVLLPIADPIATWFADTLTDLIFH